jgi:hypothetical protein
LVLLLFTIEEAVEVVLFEEGVLLAGVGVARDVDEL